MALPWNFNQNDFANKNGPLDETALHGLFEVRAQFEKKSS